MPDVLDLRFLPVAYAIGHIAGLAVSWYRHRRDPATPFSVFAGEIAPRLGLVMAAIYLFGLTRGIAGVP